MLVDRGVSGFNQIKIGTVLWMHISTGQLCIEVNDSQEQDPTKLPWIPPSNHTTTGVHSFGNKPEADLLAHMSLDDIHRIFSSSAKGTCLGSLSWPIPGYNHPFNLYSKMSLFDLGPPDVVTQGWMASESLGVPSTLSKKLAILPNGWTRQGHYKYHWNPCLTDNKHRVGLKDVPINEICLFGKILHTTAEAELRIKKSWLSQANHVMVETNLHPGRSPLP
jgi:hypothetical protein